MMASGSQNLTTYVAKRIIGDSTNVNWTGALLHSGTGGKTNAMDTWIFADDYGTASSTYGILHRQSNDKIVFVGASADRFWNDLNTGDTYIDGKLGIGYNPETSGNSYILYTNGSSYFSDVIHLPNGLLTGNRISGTGSGIEITNDGGIEIYHTSTPFIDFHYNSDTADYTYRLTANHQDGISLISKSGVNCWFYIGNGTSTAGIVCPTFGGGNYDEDGDLIPIPVNGRIWIYVR